MGMEYGIETIPARARPSKTMSYGQKLLAGAVAGAIFLPAGVAIVSEEISDKISKSAMSYFAVLMLTIGVEVAKSDETTLYTLRQQDVSISVSHTSVAVPVESGYGNPVSKQYSLPIALAVAGSPIVSTAAVFTERDARITSTIVSYDSPHGNVWCSFKSNGERPFNEAKTRFDASRVTIEGVLASETNAQEHVAHCRGLLETYMP